MRNLVLPILFVATICIFSCSRTQHTVPANKLQPVTSPSGQYVLTVPIGKHPFYPRTPAWTVTIHDTRGELVYSDKASDFIGTLGDRAESEVAELP